MTDSTNANARTAVYYLLTGLFARSTSVLVPLLFSPFLIRVWGIEKYSYWMLIYQISISFSFIDFGISSIIVNKVNLGNSNDDSSEIATAIVATTYISILLLLIILLFSIFFHSIYTISLAVACLINPTTIISKVRLAFHQNYIQNVFDAMAKLIPFLTVFIFIKPDMSIETTCLIFYISQFFIQSINAFSLLKNTNTRFKASSFHLLSTFSIISQSREVFASQLLYFFVYGIEPIVIEKLFGVGTFGTYSVHRIPFDLYISLISLILPMIWPLVNQNMVKNNFGIVKNLIRRSSIFLIGLYFIFASIILLGASYIIGIISNYAVELNIELFSVMSIYFLVYSFNILQINILLGLKMYNQYFQLMLRLAILSVTVKLISYHLLGISYGMAVWIFILVIFMVLPTRLMIKSALNRKMGGV